MFTSFDAWSIIILILPPCCIRRGKNKWTRKRFVSSQKGPIWSNAPVINHLPVPPVAFQTKIATGKAWRVCGDLLHLHVLLHVCAGHVCRHIFWQGAAKDLGSCHPAGRWYSVLCIRRWYVTRVQTRQQFTMGWNNGQLNLINSTHESLSDLSELLW